MTLISAIQLMTHNFLELENTKSALKIKESMLYGKAIG
jgi:hypothetical protein